MKKQLVKILTLIMLLIVVNPSVYAADYTVRIDKLQETESGSAYISPVGGWASKNGCRHGGWIAFSTATEGGRIMYSSALAAMMADKRVTVRFDGNCRGNYDKTTMIRVLRN